VNDQGFRILRALDQVAEGFASTPAQVALAWLLARLSVTAPIASATSVEQLKDLIQAVRLELDSAAVEHLNQASG
jgi:aryl-alcohol dehydrogenase-like predicted oxidoreductase